MAETGKRDAAPPMADPEPVPVAFSVRTAARNTAIGAVWVWALATALAGLLGGPGVALVGLVCGLLTGWGGGALCGWIAGLAVRQRSPPLVARELRRMGRQWALGTVLGGAVAVAVGVVLVSGWELTADASKPVLESLFEGCFELFGLLLLVLALIPVGFFFGTGLVAAFLARRLRMRAEELSRWRVWGLALAWTVTGVATGLLAILSTMWIARALGLRG